MKVFLSTVLYWLPAFFHQVWSIASDPKAFVAKKSGQSIHAVQDGLQFLSVSIVLMIVLLVPLHITAVMNESDYTTVTRFIIVGIFNLSLSVGVLALSWRIVGGQVPLTNFFVASCYFSGIANLIWAVVSLAALGTLYTFDPIHFDEIRKGHITLEAMDSVGWKAYLDEEGG